VPPTYYATLVFLILLTHQ